MGLQEVRWRRGLNWSGSGEGHVVGFCGHGNEAFGSREFFD